MGLYHSIFEWFHPLYLADKANGYTTSRYVDEVYLPQAKEINTLYKPDLIWSDGDWEANSSYWKSPELLAWLYNEAPNREEVIVNDRWGSDNPPIGSGKRDDRSCPLDHVPLQMFHFRQETLVMHVQASTLVGTSAVEIVSRRARRC
jgi:hypothetical protein